MLALINPVFAETDTSSPLQWDSTQNTIRVTEAEPAVETWFTYRNAGDQPITITAIETGCDCATAELDRSTLYPGESGALLAAIRTRNKELPAVESLRVRFSVGSGEQRDHHAVELLVRLLPPP